MTQTLTVDRCHEGNIYSNGGSSGEQCGLSMCGPLESCCAGRIFNVQTHACIQNVVCSITDQLCSTPTGKICYNPNLQACVQGAGHCRAEDKDCILCKPQEAVCGSKCYNPRAFSCSRDLLLLPRMQYDTFM